MQRIKRERKRGILELKSLSVHFKRFKGKRGERTIPAYTFEGKKKREMHGHVKTGKTAPNASGTGNQGQRVVWGDTKGRKSLGAT